MSLSEQQLEQIRNATNEQLEQLIRIPQWATGNSECKLSSEAQRVWNRVQLSKEAEREKVYRLHVHGTDQQKHEYLQKLIKPLGRLRWNPNHH